MGIFLNLQRTGSDWVLLRSENFRVLTFSLLLLLLLLVVVLLAAAALLCLRGTRRKRRAVNISDIDFTSESAQARI